MRGTAGMQNGAGVRELLHQQAGSTRMIQMDMGEKDIVHGCTRDPEYLQRGQQVRNRVVRTDIDESRAALVLNDVRGGVTRIKILGIDSRDAVRVVQQFGAQEPLRRMSRVCERGTRIHIVTLYATVCICWLYERFPRRAPP